MTTKRRKFTNKCKATVALAAIKEQKTLAELSKEFEVSPNQISLWKQEAIRNMEKAFGNDRDKSEGKTADGLIGAAFISNDQVCGQWIKTSFHTLD